MDVTDDDRVVEFQYLTKDDITNAARNRIALPRHALRTRPNLDNYVLSQANDNLLEELRRIAKVKKAQLENKQAAKRKRKVENREEHNKRKRIQTVAEEEDSTRYLELPTEEDVRRCYISFYNATSANALAMAVCAVCACEKLVEEAGFSVVKLSAIPNRNRLIPRKAHPAHDLYDGVLLEPKGVCCVEGSEPDVRICRDCLKELGKQIDIPPPRSLANNLWVGRVPWQLSSLTYPERLLVARAYPRVYTFKLHPKTLNARMDVSSFQRGMKGTVSTYALNRDAMADMVSGRIMPRPISVLPELISIVFFGRGKLPISYLRSLFKVWRRVVLEALLWLKANNKTYYGDINIDDERLRSLPEDDIPAELLDIVRQSEDIGIVEEESAGYVNNDADGERDKT